MQCSICWEGFSPQSANYIWSLNQGLRWQITRLGQVPSTQAVARVLAESGSAEGKVVIAEAQTEGRGHRGRRWHSGHGGLYMTTVLRPRSVTGLVPLMAGVAVAETIRDTADIDVRLKWPNDILIDGRKVSGILAESAWSRSEVKHILLGIGVNLNNQLPPTLTEATTLSDELGTEVDIDWFLHDLLKRLDQSLGILEKEPDGILEAWRGLSSTLWRWVEVVTCSGETVRGVAVDIDHDGALVFEMGGRRRHVVSGSLRDTTIKF